MKAKPKWGARGGAWSVPAADVLDYPDVAAIRGAERLTQEAFAKRYGFTHSSVRAWEQRRRRPALSARVLLTILAREPAAVRRALGPMRSLAREGRAAAENTLDAAEDTDPHPSPNPPFP